MILAEKLQQLLATQLSDAVLGQVEQLINEASQHYQADWASHMTPVIEDYALLGRLLAALHHGNLLSFELYPKLLEARQSLLGELCLIFGQPHGHFTHGAGYANLEALWWARDQQPKRHTVYASDACHYSIHKACDLLGVKLELIASDDQERMQLDQLQQHCQHTPPLAIIAHAGTTRSGAIDDISALVELSQNYQSWLHVDAAWGGALAFVGSRREMLGAISQADSISFDPHKALQQPRPCGLLFYRHQPTKTGFDADYLQFAPERTLPGSNGAELFLPLWLGWQQHGMAFFSQQIENRLAQADQFAEKLQQLTGWPMTNGHTGIICFEAASHEIHTALQGQHFSGVHIGRNHMLRTVFSSQHQRADALIEIVASAL